MDSERAKIIDELGAIAKRLAPWRDDIARETVVKKKIRAWPEIDKLSPIATKAYLGAKYYVMLGICAETHPWKPGAYAVIFGLLKKALFLKTCKVTLEAATEAVGEAVVADLVVTERTGSRTLIVAERTQ